MLATKSGYHLQNVILLSILYSSEKESGIKAAVSYVFTFYTHLYTSIHIYTHLYTSIHIYTHLYTSIHIYTHLYTSIHILCVEQKHKKPL